MPEVHILQWTVMFAGALWLTAKWLLEQPAQRWRHLTAGIAATLMWIPVAYTANNVADANGGVTTVFGSSAMAGVATFMVVLCIGGLVVGLLLWVESTTDAASAELPSQMRRGRRGD